MEKQSVLSTPQRSVQKQRSDKLGDSGEHMPQAAATLWESQTKGPGHSSSCQGAETETTKPVVTMPQPQEEDYCGFLSQGGSNMCLLTTC